MNITKKDKTQEKSNYAQCSFSPPADQCLSSNPVLPQFLHRA